MKAAGLFVVMLILPVWAPSAQANPIDFSCDSTNVSGTHSGCGAVYFFTFQNGNSRYNTSYVHLFDPSQFPGETFTLSFITGLFSPSSSTASGGTISVVGNLGDRVSGTIGTTQVSMAGCTVGQSSGQCITLDFQKITWTVVSSGVQSVLGSNGALGGGTDINFFHKTHTSASDDVDVTVLTKAPEPTGIALLGSGLLAVGGLFRRSLKKS